jgi:hypothetical protein
MPPLTDFHIFSSNLELVNTHIRLQQTRENVTMVKKEEFISQNITTPSRNNNDDSHSKRFLQKQQRRRNTPVVSFHDELSIVEFPCILGDNPACSSGAPITMDWIPQRRYSVSLLQQERQEQVESRSTSVPCHSPNNQQVCLKKKMSFALTAQQRYDRLVQNGVSTHDIRVANRQRQRLRQQRRATVENIELDETIQMFVAVARHTKHKMVQLWSKRRPR